MSQFKCEVVPVKLEPHPNADNLSIVKVWGYTVVVRTEDWKGLDRGVYIPPDSLVPLHERFYFLFEPEALARWHELCYDHEGELPEIPRVRVTVRRFRGVYSQGLLMPCSGLPVRTYDIGDDVAESWMVTHYEPPIVYHSHGQKAAPAVPGPPGLVVPKYDVENFNRYGDCLPEGTPVYVTEKIHGCNARYVWTPNSEDKTLGWYGPLEGPEYQSYLKQVNLGKMFCGSRSQWKLDAECDPWWQALRQNPWIEEWCRTHPNMVLYGEVFGNVQDLKYGAKNGELFFRAFDVLDHGRWMNYCELEEHVGPDQRVPVVFLGPFDEALVREIAERDSVVCPGQLSEGVVICPLVEMTHHAIGRVQLKIVSNRYLEKAK